MLEIKKNTSGDKKTKRRRVALACEGCRQRKTRCDGVQPTCGICQKRKIPCVYGKRYTRAHVSVDYVKSLEEKLGILSNDGKSKSNFFDRSPSVASTQSIKDETPHDEDEDEENNEDYEEIENKSNGGSETNSHIMVSYPDSVVSEAQFSPDIQRQNFRFNQTESSEYSTTDAMGAGSGTNPNVKNKDKSFYGKSAAMSFMKELFVSVDGGKLSDEEVESSRKCKYKMSRSEKPSNKSIDSIKLPPRSVANNYVKNYFDYAYPLYPFIHKSTFMAAYEEIWSAGGDRSEVDELFYSIVNVIFAFGYRLSPTGELLETNTNANVYFERSQELLRFHLMDSGSLLLIQALLLTGQFLQATTRLAGCWNIVGLAIRIAQGLGLHMKKSMSPKRSYIEQEIEKRLWDGCLLMDKIVSMTFGRPLMVVQDHVQEAPVYIDDEFITDTSINYPPIEKPSVLSFFSETVKLYDILAEILNIFYTDSGPDCVDLLVSIFKFQERLYDFQDNIPNHIKFGHGLLESPYQRQSIVLHIRYLHLKIMLYRPVLFPKNRDQVSNSGINRTELYMSSQRSISALCVDTAMELISIISRYRSADITLLPAIWYNVFYIYTAASVLLAAKLQPSLQDDLDKIKFESSWTMMSELLSSYKSQSKSAARCLKVLEMMNDRIKFTSQKRSKKNYSTHHQPEESYSTNSESEIPTDLLYSLMYDTEGPFGGPFFYNNEFDRII